MRRRSKGLQRRWVGYWLLGLLIAAPSWRGPSVVAQTPAPATAGAHGAQGDPAMPPAVDSDPVPSPDPIEQLGKPSGSAGQSGTQTSSGSGSGVVTDQGGRYTLRAEAYEVRLNASVFDASGREIDDLPQDAFRIYEDGVPQSILGFRHEDLPVSLGILIDSSGSMYDKRAAVDAASLDLVRLSNQQDEAQIS